MSCYKNYRVVKGMFGDVHYFHSIEEAKKNRNWCKGRIECYVYGIGWVRWCEAMREVIVDAFAGRQHEKDKVSS